MADLGHGGPRSRRPQRLVPCLPICVAILAIASFPQTLSRAPLSSGDFIVTPDFGSPSHLKYFYDRPKSLHVVDIGIMTPDHGTIASTDIRLRLMPSDN